MKPKKSWYLAIGALVALLAVAVAEALGPSGTALNRAVRGAAMLGYLCVFLATISSIYVRELVRLLGRPFIRAHHIASVTGLLLLLVHPLAAAWELRSMAVFIPVTDSWSGFLRWGGRPALYLMLIGALAAVLRKPLGRNWRLVHWLNYLVLLLATVHAVLLGSDFRSLAGRAVIALIALTGVGVFVRRRIPARRPRARR